MKKNKVTIPLRTAVLGCVLILILIWPLALEASTGIQLYPLTLTDALDLAIQQNPEIVASGQALELSSSKLHESRAMWQPKVTLQGSGYGTSASSPPGFLTPGGNSLLRVTASQSVPGILPEPFSVGLSPSELAAINLDEAEFELIKTKQRVVLETISAYLNVLRAEQLKDLRDAAYERAKHLLDEVETKFTFGLATQLDLLKAENQVDQASFSRLKTMDDLCGAMRSLALMLGLPAETQFRLSNDFEALEVFQEEKNERSFEELAAIALDNRVEVKQADLSLLKVRSSLESTKRSMKPSVSLSANYSYQDNISVSASALLDLTSGDASWKASLDNGQSAESISNKDRELTPRSTSSIGIDVSFDLWDGGAAREKLRQAEINLKMQEAAWERQNQAIVEDVYGASTGSKQALLRLQLAEKAVHEAEESLRITEARFQAGAAVITEVIDAAQSLATAKSEGVEALFDYYIAQVRLAKAIGLLGTEGWDK